MKNQICTILGGGGFIGRYLVRNLSKKNYRCIIPTRNAFQKGYLKTQGTPGAVELIDWKSNNFDEIKEAINISDQLIVSIFAGRIADTGRNPESIIKKCVDIRKNNKIKILWASTREFYNIIQAQNSKCDIITITPEIYAKKILKNYNLEKYSTETSLMFYNDAKKLNLNI